MEMNMIPKWQRELKSFIGIKSGIIIEGNIYDEYPLFDFKNSSADFEETDDMNRAIISLVDTEQTEVIFFDPVDGFYCEADGIEEQRKILEKFLDGYATNATEINHGCTVCLMPTKKNSSGRSEEANNYLFASEIIRTAVSDIRKFTEKKKVLFVLNFASRLNACNPKSSDANKMFLNLMATTTSRQTYGFDSNTVIMVVDKYNDIPAWVYLNNPNIRTISICMPDRVLRRQYLENLCGNLEMYKVLADEEHIAGKKFVAETEGLRLQEISQIIKLAYNSNISPENIDLAFKLYKYGVMDNPWEMLDKDITTDLKTSLEKRVKGQDAAIEKVRAVVTRAVKGLSGIQHSSASRKPKGILFFAGPTGVGKTETAKAIAEVIFGDEEACVRFDMSEYRLEHSEQKLFGAPPGYVGYEGGGQLTNAIKSRPFSILLFDEIEKAHPTILDKFLQILEDGRMTDNQGNTVYFSETIIIFTSNIGLTKEVEDPYNYARSVPKREPTIKIEDPEKEDTEEFRKNVVEVITQGVVDYFNDNGRPELLNRLGMDNIVVFQFIDVEAAKAICDYKLSKICEFIKADKNIEIDTTQAIDWLRTKAVLERSNGGRGVGNMLERDFVNPFSTYVAALPEMPSMLRCTVADNKICFEVV